MKVATPIAVKLGSSSTASGPGTSDKAGDEWPMFHGSLNHTGVTTTTPEQNSNSYWIFTTGGGVGSSPAISGGRVYVGSNDHNIYCLNANTGAKLWNYTTGNSVDSSPAVAGGRVFVKSEDGNLYCLNATTGVKMWSVAASSGYSSPAVSGGLVYVGGLNGYIYCFNATTGAQVWAYNTSVYILLEGYYGDIVASPAVVGGRVYIGNEDGWLYCFNSSTGEVMWSYQVIYGYAMGYAWGVSFDSSPTVANGLVYVGNDLQESVTAGLYCFNATTGTLVWSTLYSSSGGYFDSSPAVAGGRVYVGGDGNQICCLNATTGAQIWTNYNLVAYPIRTSPAVANGFLYIGDNEKLFCQNATIGTPVWSYITSYSSETYYPGISVDSSPAIANGRVYVGSENGTVYCFPMILSATPPTVPTAPQSFTATPGCAQVTLTWSAPASNGGAAITGYRIFQGTTPGNEPLLATIGNVLAYTSTGLANGQVYYFEVAAVNSVGTGANSTEISASTATVPGAPQALVATVGYMQVTLTWSAPASNGGSTITGYCVFQGTAPGNETLLATIGNVLTYTSTGLVNGQIYYFEVAAVNSVGTGANSTETSMTPQIAVPTAPQTFTATAGNTQVVLTWTAPVSNGGLVITGYNVYCGMTSGGETQLAVIGNVTTYTSTGLTNGQIYYFQVSTVNAMGNGVNSREATAIPATVPTAPQTLTATLGNTQVVLTWTAPASNGGTAITGYHVYKGTTSGGETLLATLGVVLAYTATGLTNGQIYYFQVSVVNAMGEGACSTEASATPATVPTALQTLTATIGNTQVVLTWTAPVSNGGSAITGYHVYKGTTSGGETLLATLGVVLTFTATGLMNGQVYYFKVAAVNGIGTGANSTEASATPATVPGAPTGLTATAGSTQVILTWVAPASNGGSAITGYRIYKGTTSGGETLQTTVGVVLNYTVTGLTNCQIYYFKVCAINAIGNGTNSTEVTATPKATVPTAPLSLTAKAGRGQVVLTWTAPASNGGSAITGYKIYQGTTSGGETLVKTVGNVLTCTITGLKSCHTYYFQVAAVNANGVGAKSSEVSTKPS